MAGKAPIPHRSEWRVVRLGDIVLKIGSGATPAGGSEVYLPLRSKYALVRSQNVFDRRFDASGLAFISDEQAEKLKGVNLQAGDLLLNITGDGITFARSCAVPEEILPACVNQHVAIVRVNPKMANPGYVLSFLTHPKVKPYIESFNAGGSRRAITKGHIESFKIPLPSLAEQGVIADILGVLDDKIDLNRRMNETLEAMARAFFKSWFVDFEPVLAKAKNCITNLPDHFSTMFPNKFEKSEIGNTPAGWRNGNLAELIEINPKESLARNSEAPYLEMADLPERGLLSAPPRLRAFASGSKFRNNDTLLARITPCLENGKTALVVGLSEQAIGWGSTEFIVMRPKPSVPPQYSYLLARDSNFREYAIQSMTGTSGRQRVQTDTLKTFPIVIPPPEVLAAFGRIVAPMFDRIVANGNQSGTLASIRDTLLPKLISGEIRIKDAERLVGAHV